MILASNVATPRLPVRRLRSTLSDIRTTRPRTCIFLKLSVSVCDFLRERESERAKERKKTGKKSAEQPTFAHWTYFIVTLI